MPVDPSILFQSKIPEYQDPLAQAGRALSLSDLATGNQLKQYMLQKQQRADTATQAVGRMLPALQAGGYSDQAVQQVLQGADPDAAVAVMDIVNQQRKAMAAASESQAKADRDRIAARVQGLGQVGGLAGTLAQQDVVDPMSVKRVIGAARMWGIDPEQAFGPLPDINDQQGMKQWMGTAAQASVEFAKQLDQKLKMNEQGIQMRGQDITQSTAQKRLEFERDKLAQEGRIADPWGIMGINQAGGGGGGAPSDVPASGGGMPQPVPRGTYASQPSQPLPTGWQPGQPLPPIPAGYTQQTTSDGIPVMAAPGQQFGNQGAGFARAAPQAAPQVFTNLQGATPQQVAAVQADAGRYQPVSGQAPPSGGGSFGNIGEAMRAGVTGEELLALMPPFLANQLRAIHDGSQPMPSINSRAPGAAQITTLMNAAFPGEDAQTFPLRFQTRQAFVGKGLEAQNIKSINTAIEHIGTLADTFQTLNNGPIPLVNQAGNYLATQGLATAADRDRIQNATAKIQSEAAAIGGEMAKVFRSQGMSVQEIKGWEDQLTAAKTPQQMKGTIEAMLTLMEGRMRAIDQSYQAGMGRSMSDANVPILSPSAVKTLQRLGFGNYAQGYGGQGGGEASAGAPSAAPAQQLARPQLGEKRDGWTYRGGDPAAPSSWAR